MSRSESSPNIVDKLVAIKQREWFIFLSVLVGIALFPWFLIEGMGMVGDVFNTELGGYEGLPALILIYGIVVIGFNILLGYTGLLSFGHAAFFGGSAYTAAFLSRAGFLPEMIAKSPILMILLGTTAAVLLAWVIGFLSIRRSGVYFAVLTLTFGQMMYFYAMGPGAWLTNGDDGYTPDPGALLGQFPLGDVIPGDLITTWFYVLVGITALIAIGAAYRILHSPYGLIFEALGQNEQRVNFVGLNVFRYKLMAFILSAAFAGVGGALFAMQTLTLHPNASLYWIVSGDFVIMNALGGVGTLLGPLFGTAVFEYIRLVLSGIEIFGFEFGGMWRLLLGGVFVIVVALFPSGIYGGIKGVFQWLVARLGNQSGPAPRDQAERPSGPGGED